MEFNDFDEPTIAAPKTDFRLLDRPSSYTLLYIEGLWYKVYEQINLQLKYRYALIGKLINSSFMFFSAFSF